MVYEIVRFLIYSSKVLAGGGGGGQWGDVMHWYSTLNATVPILVDGALS